MAKILKIELETDDKITAYRAVNFLATNITPNVKKAKWGDGKEYIFTSPEDIKNFLKDT